MALQAWGLCWSVAHCGSVSVATRHRMPPHSYSASRAYLAVQCPEHRAIRRLTVDQLCLEALQGGLRIRRQLAVRECCG
jgi:hypothetical protein